MGVAWFTVDIIVGGVVVLLLIVRGEGEIPEFLVIFFIHFPELSGKTSVDIVLEFFPLGFLPLLSPLSDSVRR